MVKSSRFSPLLCALNTRSLVHMYTVLEGEGDSPTHVFSVFEHILNMCYSPLFICGQMCGVITAAAEAQSTAVSSPYGPGPN